MNKKVLIALLSVLSASCLRAADAEDAETKKLTTESFKRELYWVAVNRGYRKLEHEKTENEKEVAKIYDQAFLQPVLTQTQYNSLKNKMDSLVPRDKKYWEK